MVLSKLHQTDNNNHINLYIMYGVEEEVIIVDYIKVTINYTLVAYHYLIIVFLVVISFIHYFYI